MPSKSKDVRIEQRIVLEKKLDLRLQQLTQKGTGKEKADIDPLVKNLKAKIRETNSRIRAVEKIEKLNSDLDQAKIQKLTAPKKEEALKETKSKKKAAAESDSKKKQSAQDSSKGAKKKQALSK
jgi:hypothetical protein